MDSAAINEILRRSQDVLQKSDTGYRLGGPGTFQIRTRNIDLGATIGGVSQGPRANRALASSFEHGADVDLHASGKLSMFFTKIADVLSRAGVAADDH